MTKLISTNPSKNFEKIGEVEISSENEISGKVKKAPEVVNYWGSLSTKERVVCLQKIYDNFEKHRNELGKLVGDEIGMPVSVRDSMEIGAGLDYFKSVVYYELTGVAAVISPWNFPLVIRSYSVLSAALP